MVSISLQFGSRVTTSQTACTPTFQVDGRSNRCSVSIAVTLDHRLTFEKHTVAVARPCTYHALAICHIWCPRSTELEATLVCSLTLTRLDYCYSLLHGAPASSIQILQHVQNSAARIILQDQDYHMHCRCYASCTGCRCITELTTSWLWWHTRSAPPQYQHTSVDTSSCTSLHGHYARLMYHCNDELKSKFYCLWHHIFILWFLLLLSSFFPRLISAAADWMSSILPHMVWP